MRVSLHFALLAELNEIAIAIFLLGEIAREMQCGRNPGIEEPCRNVAKHDRSILPFVVVVV